MQEGQQGESRSQMAYLHPKEIARYWAGHSTKWNPDQNPE